MLKTYSDVKDSLQYSLWSALAVQAEQAGGGLAPAPPRVPGSVEFRDTPRTPADDHRLTNYDVQ
jgi:hypothetical protein